MRPVNNTQKLRHCGSSIIPFRCLASVFCETVTWWHGREGKCDGKLIEKSVVRIGRPELRKGYVDGRREFIRTAKNVRLWCGWCQLCESGPSVISIVMVAVVDQTDSGVLCWSLPRCKGQQSCSFPLGAEGKLKNLQDANYDSSEAGTKFRYQHVLYVTLFAGRFLSTSMPLYYLCLRFSVSVRAPAWGMRLQICLQCLWKSAAGTPALYYSRGFVRPLSDWLITLI